MKWEKNQYKRGSEWKLCNSKGLSPTISFRRTKNLLRTKYLKILSNQTHLFHEVMFVEFRNLEFLRASFGCCKLGPVQTSHALRVSSNLVFSALGLAERLSEGFALFHKSLLIWPFSSKIEKVLEKFKKFVRHRRISLLTANWGTTQALAFVK